MELVDEIVEDPSCVFIFPTPEKLRYPHISSYNVFIYILFYYFRPPLLKIEEGDFGYTKESPQILKNINFHLDCESRIAVVGANGVGKSTFLKLLVGNLELNTGNQYRNGRLRVSMFT